MRRIAKKGLAMLLCVTLCIIVPFPVAVGAEENGEKTTREALIEAWQALATESKPMLDVIAVPKEYEVGSDSQKYYRTAVTANTAVEGLSDASVLGPYYINKLKMTENNGKSNVWLNFTMPKTPVDFTQYSSVYVYVGSFDHTGAPARNKINTQVNHKNSKYDEFSGWKKIELRNTETAGTAVKFYLQEFDYTYVSYGSVQGVYTYTPALPQNYETLSLGELITQAKAIDCEGFRGTEAFKNALAEAEEENLLCERLITAWEALRITHTEEVAVPDVVQLGTDGNEYTRQPVTAGTTVNGLADATVLGSYYVDKMALNKPGWNTKVQGKLVVNEGCSPFSQYDTVYVWVAAHNAAGGFVKVKVNVQVNSANSAWTEGTGWTKAAVSTAGSGTGITVVVEEGPADLAALSIGGAFGSYTVAATLPENVEELSLRELVAAATAYDISACHATADFTAALIQAKEALSSKEQEEISLIEAWKSLRAWRADEIGFLAGGKWLVTTTVFNVRTTDLAALTDEQIASMGTYVAALEKVGDIAGGLSHSHMKDLTGYEKITWSVYNAGETNAAVDLNLNSYSGDSWLCSWMGVNARTFKTFTFDATNSVAKKLFNGEIKATKPYAKTESKDASWTGKVYFGTPLAWKRTSVALPENVSGLTEKELCEAAAAVDLSRCTEGREAFETALCTLYERYRPEEAALIKAWRGLGETALPGTVYAMSVTELYDAAAAVDVSLYETGVAEFKSALIEYCRYVHPERAALIEIWETTGKPLPENVYAVSNEALYKAAMALDLTGCENVAAFKAALRAFEAKVATVILPETGAITADNALAKKGESVTLTVDPTAIKAGSLKILDRQGKTVAVPTRLNFRNGGHGNTFTFRMPADTVSVQAEEAPTDTPNMGVVGWSYNSEKIGLRSVHRVYVTNRNGTYYTAVGGVEEKVQDYGVIVGTVADLTVAEKGAKRISFLETSMRYDVCAEYEDISVTVVGMNSQQQLMPIYSCSYITVAGETYYSDIASKTYREVASATVKGEGTVQSVTLLTERPTALEKVEFEAVLAELSGNVYDDDEVSLTMELTGPDNTTLSVIGFYYVPYAADGEYSLSQQAGTPSWRFRFSPTVAGEWQFSVILRLNGAVAEQLNGFAFYVAEATDPTGFLSVEPNHKQTFVFEDGSDYTVIGQNIAWSEESNDYGYYAERMNRLAEGGGNFIRIWLTQWDLALQTALREPDDLRGGMYRAATLDAIMALAEEKGIYVELCIFHHGQFSTIVNPVWDGNPYNSMYSTGYLSEPKEFFTSERAKEDTEDYLRYIVARWGYSPHIMCWQLFNEANITENETEQMYQWHEEMCAYLRSIDWQNHMITTSVAAQNGVITLDCFDYMCAHYYDYYKYGNVKILCEWQDAMQAQYDRPYLFDEVGQGTLDENLISIHQQNWAGLMGGGPGAAVNWYWKECHTIPGYYDTFAEVKDFAARIPWSDPNRRRYNTGALADNQSAVYTVGYGSDTYAYLWSFDNGFNNVTRVETTFTNYTVTVPLANGTYTATWIDPWSGETVVTKTVTAQGGSVTLTAPTFTRDLAVAVEPIA